MIFFTIVTKDYIPLAKVLYKSIDRHYSHPHKFYIFVTSINKEPVGHDGNVKILWLKDLLEFDEFKKAYDVLGVKDIDSFRWALKPVVAKYLLENGAEKVIYCDSDLYFISTIDELESVLEDYNIFLSPHWFPITPSEKNGYFKKLFFDGLYNGGFIGFNHDGMAAIQWWMDACAYNCTKDQKVLNTYVDQTYLNLLPLYFEKVKVLSTAYNFAGWNDEFIKVYNDNNQLVNESGEKIRFIHFSHYTVDKFWKSQNPLLRSYVASYFDELKKEGINAESKFFKKRNVNWYIARLLPRFLVDRYSIVRKTISRIKS